MSAPAAVFQNTYSPVLFTALPPVGRVHPVGVVDVTAPSTKQTSRFPAVGLNNAPADTDPELGSTV